MKISRRIGVFLLFVFLASQTSFGQSNQIAKRSGFTVNRVNYRFTKNYADTIAENHIVFLMLKLYKDSLTGKDTLILLDEIKKPGSFKANPYREGLSRLPYLSIIFYKNDVPVDSIRYGYPLRERIQKTKETPQGYKDVEKRSVEFFIRFLQKEADKVTIDKIAVSGKTDLLTVDL
jgi:putative lipase involved disintegration of autophagic bodies